MAAVPAELRTPALHLPLPLTSHRAARLVRRLGAPPYAFPAGVEHTVRSVPPRDGRPGVDVHLYQRRDRTGPTGALCWVHGGGFVIGNPALSHEFCSQVAAELGVLVVSVDYRLAPEHPFPAALDDCAAGLRWLVDEAGALDVDPARIAVGGISAGGGLAACLAQRATDEGLPLALQLLVYPMLDDRTALRSDHRGTGELVWTPASNRFGWTSYLGRPPVWGAAPEYAVAARREGLSGLPPAWIGVGDLDLFLAEDLAYAERLRAAGVATDLVVVPGMYHGAEGLPGSKDAASMLAFTAAKLAALRSALA